MPKVQKVTSSRTNQLRLEFNNSTPFRARDLSDLFGALARDYQRLNPGRELIVAEIHSGSLITVLRDALGVIASVVTIIDFGKIIAEGIELTRKAPSLLFHDKTAPAARTVEKLLEAAAHSRSSVKLRYEGPNGEKLLAQVTPIEASELSGAVRRSKKKTKKLRVSNENEILEDSLRAITDSRDTGPILKTIATILLRQRLTRVLQNLADELRRLGRNEEAQILANEIRKARSSIADESDREIPF